MNIEKIITQLVNKQNQVTDPMDFALLGEAIEKLKVSKVFFVNYVDGLPDASTLPSGTLYYVRNEKSLYLAKSSLWLNLSNFNTSNIYSFGIGSQGQLGNFCVSNQSSPVRLYSNINDWVNVSSGACHTLALRNNGTLWAWGSGALGRLGDGTTVAKSSPVSVVGGFNDWCQVSAGFSHSHGIKTNGILYAWGQNAQGQLGDNSTTNRCSPVSVAGGFTDWCQVDAGGTSAAAVRTDGTLWLWGNASDGRLGDGVGGAACRSSPISVLGGYTDWCQVSVGYAHTAAVRTNGTLWSWGANGCGRLGDGTTVNKCSPVSVVGGFTDWCQVSAGGGHTAALRTNGTLWTWGEGGNSSCGGPLGDGTTVAKSSPVSVVGGFTDWCQVSAGAYHTAALRTNATLWAWGRNQDPGSNFVALLGDGTLINRCSPVSVIGNFTDWSKVSAGDKQTVAVRTRN